MTLIVVAACGAEAPVPSELRSRLESVFEGTPKSATPDEIRQAIRLRTPAPIKDFYSKHGYLLLWSDAGGRPLPRTRTLLETLRQSADHGLVPADYAVDRLEALTRSEDRSAARLADLDLLATSAYFRYASDVSSGRVHPDEVHGDWHTSPPEIDPARALDEALARNDLEGLLASLPPPHAGYARLREALAKLRAVAAGGGWPLISPGPKMARGSRDPRVAVLRQRLGVPPGDRFDAALAAAVQHFQSLHGIEPDGIVSDATLAELNAPAEERVVQVELNLERWRWIPRDLGNPHVLVNIAGFDLELATEGQPSWRTRVATGKAFTPTPVFSDRIVALVVHPHWNVPESIAVGEFLPTLKQNPRALSGQAIRVLEGSGDKAREVDPARIDWSRVDADRFPYRLRQDPGDANPLGRIKFDLTNDFHVYLHDTPGGGVFGRTDRDVSHGCIRVEGALDLAERIAGDAARTKLHEALEQPEERRVDLDSRIPVHILYWTAWADEAGELHFAQDVYGFDPPQRAALDKMAGGA